MQIQTNALFKNLQKKKYFEMLPDFKEEKTQKFTTLVFTIIALIFFGLFAINPTLSTIANLNKQLSDSQYVDSQLKTKINNLYALQQNYAAIQPDMTYILSSFPKTPEAPTLVGQIQSVAKDAGITITNFQIYEVQIPDPSTPKKGFYAFNFSIVANGTYDAIMKFSDAIVKMQRISVISTISITKASGEGGSQQLNFKGTAYFKE
jgi:Tfp pilus assembly protein PilO